MGLAWDAHPIIKMAGNVRGSLYSNLHEIRRFHHEQWGLLMSLRKKCKPCHRVSIVVKCRGSLAQNPFDSCRIHILHESTVIKIAMEIDRGENHRSKPKIVHGHGWLLEAICYLSAQMLLLGCDLPPLSPYSIAEATVWRVDFEDSGHLMQSLLRSHDPNKWHKPPRSFAAC